jgi:Cu(I)/Ag(I) efflux system periplasmic protein CusF
MKKTILTLGLSALLGAGGAFASGDHAAHVAGASAATPAGATTPPIDPVTEGEVRKIDREQGKITLKHGEIRNLDMPGMTMVFRVKEPALLDKVKEGDKVGFTADKIGGLFTVTGIDKK